MLKSSRMLIISLVLGVTSVMGCSRGNPPVVAPVTPQGNETTNKLNLTVSIPPQEYFVERIGKDKVKINVMIPQGVDPHTFEPKPEQLRDLSQTKAYFSIGVSLEQAWMNRLKSANSKMLVVDTSQGVDKLPLLEDEHGHQQQENLDPHIWSSPKRVKVQAKTIYDTLVKLDPTHQAEYKANLDRFLKDIDQLDAEIKQNLSGIKNRKFMVFHPEWGYFAQDYGLQMIPIEVNGTEPSAAELSKLINEAKKEGIKVIFAQPEFSSKSANTIAQEIGGEVILISVLSPDWMDNLRQVSAKMGKLLSQYSSYQMSILYLN